jgi:aminomethyltransferase
MTMPPVRHTPYYHRFVELGATIATGGGWAVPRVFTSTEEEHRATRENVALYDVYGQGPLDVKGKDAHAVLNRIVVNDLDRLDDGEVIYTSIVNEQGGMLDDLTVYRLSREQYWLVCHPNRDKIIEPWINEHKGDACCHVTNLIAGTGYLSVQGPKSRELLSRLTTADMSTDALPYYTFVMTDVAEVPMMLARTGYSGELGYELYYPFGYGEHIWDSVLDAGADLGVKPAGMAALLSTRMEKRFPIMGLDIFDGDTPVEAGIGWTVRRNKQSDYIGREVLDRQKAEGTRKRLVVLELSGMNFVPKKDDSVAVGARDVGKVTSADKGYTLGNALALAWVDSDVAAQGGQATVRSAESGEDYAATIYTRAPYDPESSRPRA